jgi:hypothetical protein
MTSSDGRWPRSNSLHPSIGGHDEARIPDAISASRRDGAPRHRLGPDEKPTASPPGSSEPRSARRSHAFRSHNIRRSSSPTRRSTPPPPRASPGTWLASRSRGTTVLDGDELRRLAARPQLNVALVYTRRAPPDGAARSDGSTRPGSPPWPGRPPPRPHTLCAGRPALSRPSPTCSSTRATRQDGSGPNGSDQAGVDGGSDDRLEPVDRRQRARRPAP